jgi:hypothetical protein
MMIPVIADLPAMCPEPRVDDAPRPEFAVKRSRVRRHEQAK